MMDYTGDDGLDGERIKSLLEQVAAGRMDVDDAVAQLRHLPFEPLGFATVDHHRSIRCGFPEVIFCAGKTPAQVEGIFEKLAEGGGNVLATRAGPEHHERIAARMAAETRGHATQPELTYHAAARCITLQQRPARLSQGTIAIVSAGTSDEPVAEEARVTAEIMDQRTARFYDVGVAGIHRLLSHTAALQGAHVIVVVAGMEGALASVVGGLVSSPVIAVPTSVGYGASFGGIAPLLTMLNSCAAGVAVVNIDNGFGAGYLAARINALAEGGS
jgi:NCAIR mutase (PurE)-related protein